MDRFAPLKDWTIIRRIRQAAARIIRHVGGNVAFGFAALTPVLIGAVGGGIDLSVYLKHQYSLQSAADSAALAAAKEGALSG